MREYKNTSKIPFKIWVEDWRAVELPRHRPKRFGRNAFHNGFTGNIFGDDASRCNEPLFINRDSRKQYRSGSDSSSALHMDPLQRDRVGRTGRKWIIGRNHTRGHKDISLQSGKGGQIDIGLQIGPITDLDVILQWTPLPITTLSPITTCSLMVTRSAIKQCSPTVAPRYKILLLPT